jgi:DNA processing protein
VVEAVPWSRSLFTANPAMEENRDVFALPGSVDSLASRACHPLIPDGARLVERATTFSKSLALWSAKFRLPRPPSRRPGARRSGSIASGPS